jgi:integrase/recombinase XerD
MTALAPTLESFFTDYLISQLGASRHTIAAYRDTWRLLLGYVFQHTGIRPSDLDMAVLDARLVGEFLTCLETERHNSPRTRNARLGAIHSFFRHAALRHPEHAAQIARVLAIPTKRTAQTVISWLTDAELGALLASPDQATWTGRRDHLLLLVMVTTGMRVGEIATLTRADTWLDRPGGHIACHGKGRKDRATPIDVTTATLLSAWFAENPGPATTALFCARGTSRPMTVDAIAQRIAVHAAHAAATCPNIAAKRVTPHVLRHTCAMRMLAAGIDSTTIALWLGHESPTSTNAYLHADMDIKQRALDRTASPGALAGRFQPGDRLLVFLEAL